MQISAYKPRRYVGCIEAWDVVCCSCKQEVTNNFKSLFRYFDNGDFGRIKNLLVYDKMEYMFTFRILNILYKTEQHRHLITLSCQTTNRTSVPSLNNV